MNLISAKSVISVFAAGILMTMAACDDSSCPNGMKEVSFTGTKTLNSGQCMAELWEEKECPGAGYYFELECSAGDTCEVCL
jgi:hypothetical protein